AGMTTRAPGSPLLVARLVWASLLVTPALYCVVLVLLLRSGAGSPSPALGDPLRTILLVLAAAQTLAVWFVWRRFVGSSGGRAAASPLRYSAPRAGRAASPARVSRTRLRMRAAAAG